ncbi:MAG: SoxR reducing system RseC family protein [Ghiorsea sp.]
MDKQGIVVGVEGGIAIVRANRESSCGSCAGKSACGTLGSWDIKEKSKNQYDIRLPNSLHAKIGDIVTVEVPEQLILTASALFYGVPVLAFMLFGGTSFVVAEGLGGSGDLYSAIGGLIGAAVAWFGLMKQDSFLEMPKIIEVCR